MGGDHKCPVCQATFTRPQHVARHMRSREFFLATLHLSDPQSLPFSPQTPAIDPTSVSIAVTSLQEGIIHSISSTLTQLIFSQSDLLSRHINKCHANEKPVPTQGRRKGSASASRATTSKQACDQCVQSSLPCDGSNPCGALNYLIHYFA